MKKKIKKNQKEKISLLKKVKKRFSEIDFSIAHKEAYNNLKKSLKDTKHILADNKLFIFYVLGATLNGVLLRLFTIKSFSVTPMFADLLISILFASIYFFIKKKYRFIYLLIISLVSTLICLANIVYYVYYSSFISVTFLSFALQNTETGDSNPVTDLLQFKTFVFVWLPIFLTLFHIKTRKKHDRDIAFRRVKKPVTLRTIYTWCLIFFILLLAGLKPVDYSRFYSQWNREYVVSRFGVYLYQINDLVKSVEPKMATLFGKDKAYKEVTDYYNENKSTSSKNKYSNIFEGKNVVAVHAESMQNVLLHMKINNKEVTPELNKMADTGIYFDNFYSQVSFGTSSDTEFTYSTSLLPVSSGIVFVNYSKSEYPSFYKKLKDDGYYNFSMHANTGDFWNRNVMHKSLGYDKLYDKSTYNIDETVGFGLSDESFIKQSVSKIKEINDDHKKFYGTLITLSNHTPFEYNELFGDFSVKLKEGGKEYNYVYDTKLGNYIVSAHYADKCLGVLRDELDKAGLLDDTIIVIYGDHDARISTYQWNKFYNYDKENDSTYDKDDSRYTDLDYYWQEQNRRVPFIIWSNDKDIQNNYSKTIHTAMGMYDAAPTLGNMLGINNEYALGKDVIGKKDNLVPFPNGNFVTNYVYYNDNKEEYKLLKDKPLSDNYIKENRAKTKKMISVSNDIIMYNYFGNLNNEFKKEEK